MSKQNVKEPGKQVTLLLMERILLTGIIIGRGNKADMIVAKDIMSKIEITQRELKDYGIQFIAGNVKINGVGAAKKFKYTFSDLEVSLIKKSFQQADAEGNYTMHLVEIEKYFN